MRQKPARMLALTFNGEYMTKRLPHVEAAKEEAERLGASFDWKHEGKKLVGYIKMNGQCRKLFMSITPSDVRAALNIKKNVRDYVKEMAG